MVLAASKRGFHYRILLRPFLAPLREFFVAEYVAQQLIKSWFGIFIRHVIRYNSADRKKSYESLADAIKELQKPDVKRAIKEAVPNDTIAKLAEIYLFNSIVNSMKFESSITPELMGKLYPDIKVRMPMGAGRKKKSTTDKKD